MQEDITKQLLSKSLHEMLSKKDNKIAEALITLNQFAYYEDSTRNITLRKDKVMSFCPANKPTIITNNDDGCNSVWSKENRQEGKYGKVLSKVLKEQAPRFEYIDKDLEELVNFLKAEVSDGEFRIVSGDDIRKWYDGDKYEDNTGSLEGSCMRHEECQDYFDIYVQNESLINMVILVKNGRLIGRALLWDGLWMDRIYGSDETIQKFKNYAKEKGYNHKFRQSYDDNETWVRPDGSEFNETMQFNVNVYGIDRYPYVDTFCFFDEDEGILSNSRDDGMPYRLTCTGGGKDDGEVMCTRSNNWVCRNEAHEINGDWYHGDYVCYDNLNEEWILDDEAVTLFNGDTTHEDNPNIVNTDSHGYILEEDAVEIDGEWYHTDTVTMCEHDNSMYPSDDVHFVDDLNKYIHEDNVESAYEDAGYIQVDGAWVLEEGNEEAA